MGFIDMANGLSLISVNNIPMTDEPWANKGDFYRRIDIKQAARSLQLPFPLGKNLEISILSNDGIGNANWSESGLLLSDIKKDATIILRVGKPGSEADDQAALSHLKAARKKSRRWVERLKIPGTLGKHTVIGHD